METSGVPQISPIQMKKYVSTTENVFSGESIEMIQLAQAMGAEVVRDVPPEGLLVYMINQNLRTGTQDFKKLAQRRMTRKGINLIIAGAGKGWEEHETWRPYFEVIRKIADIVFAHHPEQVEYLRAYGIEPVVKPLSEESYRGPVRYKKCSVVYTGFLWDEKDLPMFLNVARLLPDWRFTIHIGKNMNCSEQLPQNCDFNGQFIPQDRYLEFLAGFEYIWIPRKPSKLVYVGRSGISAVASGRPAILTDVPANSIIPNGVAIKYPYSFTAEQIAELIKSRPVTDADEVRRFLDGVSPEHVWQLMKFELEKRGFSGF